MSEQEEAKLNFDSIDYRYLREANIIRKEYSEDSEPWEDRPPAARTLDRLEQWVEAQFQLQPHFPEIVMDVYDRQFFHSCDSGEKALLVLRDYQDKGRCPQIPVPDWARPLHSHGSTARCCLCPDKIRDYIGTPQYVGGGAVSHQDPLYTCMNALNTSQGVPAAELNRIPLFGGYANANDFLWALCGVKRNTGKDSNDSGYHSGRRSWDEDKGGARKVFNV